MKETYVTDREFQNLMEDLTQKLENGEIGQAKEDLQKALEDVKERKSYIDRTYLSQLKDQKRRTRISEITTMLNNMNNEQVENVYVYAVNEYDEPNHEAVALDAIIRLSRERGKNE